MLPIFGSRAGGRKLYYTADLPSFQRDFASLKTLDHGTGPNITFTRGSNATYFDADGVLQTASTNIARFDHSTTGSSLGLLIEESRTNSIRNSQAGGATNGVIGSGGVLPTNWTATNHNTNGVSTEVIGSGTEDGLGYVDLKISGTPTASAQAFFNFESDAQIAAANGQTWTNSVYVKLSGGSMSNASVRVGIFGRDSSGSNVAGQAFLASAFTPTTASLKTQRQFATYTFTSASVARLLATLRFDYTSGSAIDVTLRIGSCQAEQGAFPTSYIPTTTAAATRAADSAVVTPISSFYNQAEGTLFAEFNRYQVAKSAKFFGFTNETNNAADYNILESGASVFDSQRYIGVTAGPSSQWQITFLSALAGTTYRMAGAYASNDFQVAQNGTLGTADTSGTIPPANAMGIGCLKGTNVFGQINGHIRKIAYWPKRLTNTLLEQLTT